MRDDKIYTSVCTTHGHQYEQSNVLISAVFCVKCGHVERLVFPLGQATTAAVSTNA